jgi:serine/threonine-protein kinase
VCYHAPHLTRIAKYEILDEIAKSPIGATYRARDTHSSRLVTLITGGSDTAANATLSENFARHAEASAKHQHPNIPTVCDVGNSDGVPYLVLEFCEGQTLAVIVAAAQNLPLVRKVGYLLGLCEGLRYAHRYGVIHRDIKPDNIFVTTADEIKIMDLSFARTLDSPLRKQTGIVIGTPAYMAPEQLRGEQANASTNIWAAGCTGYEILSYRRPFRGENPAALMVNIVSKTPTPLRELVPECPCDLEQLIDKMLRKDPRERFQSMDDLIPELSRIRNDLSIS